jgi:hypothetical protein
LYAAIAGGVHPSGICGPISIGLCPEYANVPITPKIGQSGGRWRLVATGRIHPLIDAW